MAHPEGSHSAWLPQWPWGHRGNPVQVWRNAAAQSCPWWRSKSPHLDTSERDFTAGGELLPLVPVDYWNSCLLWTVLGSGHDRSGQVELPKACGLKQPDVVLPPVFDSLLISELNIASMRVTRTEKYPILHISDWDTGERFGLEYVEPECHLVQLDWNKHRVQRKDDRAVLAPLPSAPTPSTTLTPPATVPLSQSAQTPPTAVPLSRSAPMTPAAVPLSQSAQTPPSAVSLAHSAPTSPTAVAVSSSPQSKPGVIHKLQMLSQGSMKGPAKMGKLMPILISLWMTSCTQQQDPNEFFCSPASGSNLRKFTSQKNFYWPKSASCII